MTLTYKPDLIGFKINRRAKTKRQRSSCSKVIVRHTHTQQINCKVVGDNLKSFSYSLPIAGPGADPGVQAVSPQVTISHQPGGRLP